MAGIYILIVLAYLITVPNTMGYTIHNRIPNFDDISLLLRANFVHFSPTSNDCIAVQAMKELGCSFLDKNDTDYGLFEAICEQHQLCYACGLVHGISKRKCHTLARVYMHEECSQNPSVEYDCLQKRSTALRLLQEDIYRLSEFSSECYDQCIPDYLYSNPNFE